jgi:hypothetical protein
MTRVPLCIVGYRSLVALNTFVSCTSFILAAAWFASEAYNDHCEGHPKHHTLVYSYSKLSLWTRTRTHQEQSRPSNPCRFTMWLRYAASQQQTALLAETVPNHKRFVKNRNCKRSISEIKEKAPTRAITFTHVQMQMTQFARQGPHTVHSSLKATHGFVACNWESNSVEQSPFCKNASRVSGQVSRF